MADNNVLNHFNHPAEGDNELKLGGTATVESNANLNVEAGGTMNIEASGAFQIAGVEMTATAAELNQNDGAWASFTTAATPASGSCAVQFVFKNAVVRMPEAVRAALKQNNLKIEDVDHGLAGSGGHGFESCHFDSPGCWGDEDSSTPPPEDGFQPCRTEVSVR